MAMKIAAHLAQLAYYDPTSPSPDIMARGVSGLDTSRMYDTLAAAHAVGDGRLTIATPRVWSDDPAYSATPLTGLLTVRDSGATNGGVSRGSMRFAYSTLGGSTTLFLTGSPTNSTTDIVCDAGSVVSRNGFDSWVNTNGSAMAANHVVAGRDTGYPAGLAAGQSMQVIHKSQPYPAVGTWTVTAKGTGTITVNGPASKSFAFVAGTCASPTLSLPSLAGGSTWIVTLTQSNAADPIHDVRVIMPGTDPVSGKTFVQLYAENAANPDYFLHHPAYLDYYRPYACFRTVDNSANNQATPPMKVDWADRPPSTQRFGYNNVRGMPSEQEVQIANEILRDVWHNFTHRESDDSVTQFAIYVRDHLDPRLKVWVEWALELWNWGYYNKHWAIARWGRETDGLASLTRSGTTATATWGDMGGRRYISGITRSGTVATATCPLHGLSVGSTVKVDGAVQSDYNGTVTVTGIPTTSTFTYVVANSPATPAVAALGGMSCTGHGLIVGDSLAITGATVQGWNGTFTVASVTGLLSLTFAVSGSPASPAVAIEDNHIFAHKDDSKLVPIDVGSLQFTMAAGAYTGSFTATGHGMVAGDWLVLSGCGNVQGNGIWKVNSVAGTTVNLILCPATTRLRPTDTAGSVVVAAASGMAIRVRKLISNAGSAGYAGSDESAARWSGRRHRQIHAIMRSVLGSRFVPVIPGWFIDSTHNASVMAQYKADSGGSFHGDEYFAIAPYFGVALGGGLDIREDASNGWQRAITSITSVGGVATVTTSGNHGFAIGDTVRIFGVVQPEYNGGFTVLSAPTATTLTYAVPGSPASPATATGDGMRLAVGVKAGTQAVTSITRSGSAATVTLAAHGYVQGMAIRLTGADQSEYNGDFLVRTSTTNTFTITVAGTPVTPATGTIKLGQSGAYLGRELTSLTSTGGVATATCPGHGLTSGQTWYVCGVDDVVTAGAITGSYLGARTITVVDANTFTFPVTGTPAATATVSASVGGSRLWMHSALTMDAGFAAMNALISGPDAACFPQLVAAMVAKYGTANGLKLACYESGQHLAATTGQANSTYYFGLVRNPRMGDCYLSYFPMLDAAGISMANSFRSMGLSGGNAQFSVMDFQGQTPVGARQAALNTLLTTTYYNAPLGGGGITPPPAEGIMRIQASLNLGNGMAGILANLRAQPQSADGSGTDTDIGSPISTGFTDKGNGFYRWDYTGLDATLVGGVRFYNSLSPAVTLGYGLVDPRQAVTTAAYVDPAAALTNAGLTPTRASKLDNLDVASSTLATPSSVSTSVGAGLTAAGFTSARALKLDNLDVAVGARFNSLDTSVASATAASTAVNGKLDATRLSKLDNLLASGTYSTFAGGAVASVTAPVAVAGSVNIGGYATGQDPASLILATPSNKLATDGNGRVSAGTVLDKVGYSVAGGVTVSGYATGQDPATLVLSTPQNRLKTDTTGRVILAAVSHDGAIVPTVGDVTNKSGFALAAAGLDTVTIEPGINIRQAISPILAASAGTLSGAGTGTVVIKGGNNAPTRITASTDNAGNRSSVTLNLPA